MRIIGPLSVGTMVFIPSLLYSRVQMETRTSLGTCLAVEPLMKSLRSIFPFPVLVSFLVHQILQLICYLEYLLKARGCIQSHVVSCTHVCTHISLPLKSYAHQKGKEEV